MRWLCIFIPCRYELILGCDTLPFGLWQCYRCKTVSVGRITGRGPNGEPSHD